MGLGMKMLFVCLAQAASPVACAAHGKVDLRAGDKAPALRLKAAASNAGVIWPLGKNPRSPPFCALESSEFFLARSAKSLSTASLPTDTSFSKLSSASLSDLANAEMGSKLNRTNFSSSGVRSTFR